MTLLPKGYRASRAFAFETSAIDVESRTVQLSIASEYPVRRTSLDGEEFWEVLVCEPGAVDLARLNSGAPLLNEHSRGDQVGIVESARVDADRVVRGAVRFGTDERAEKLWHAVAVDEIRPNVSCMYEVLRAEVVRPEKLGEPPTVRVTRWAPSEVSTVAIGADPTVGVGRSAESQLEQGPELRPLLNPAPEAPAQEIRVMETLNPTPAVDVTAIREQARSAEQARCREIQAIGARFDGLDVAKAIAAGTSVEEFRGMALDQLETQSRSRKPMVDLSSKDEQRYNLGAVVQALLTGNRGLAGHELEITRAYEQANAKMGRQMRGHNSFYVPFKFLNGAFGSRAIVQKGSTGTGDELIATDHWASEYVPHLVSDLAVVRAGARVIPGLVGDADIPAGDGSFATAGHIGETADGSEVIPAFKTIPLVAKGAGAHVPFTRRMRLQAQPALESIVRQGLNDALAELVERTCFNGAGSATVPRGILNTSGVVAADFTGSPLGSYFDYINMWAKLKGAKGTSQKLAYMTNYQVMTQALTTPRTEGDAKMIAALLGSGLEAQIDGLRMFATQEFPTDLGSPSENTGVIFGDWSKLVIGVFGDGIEISTTEAPLALSGGLVVTAFLDYDLAVTQPKSFSVADNIPAA